MLLLVATQRQKLSTYAITILTHQRHRLFQRTEAADGAIQPVHSFRTLLDDLATLTRNTVCFAGEKTLTVQTTPTPVQRRALSLLGVELAAA